MFRLRASCKIVFEIEFRGLGFRVQAKGHSFLLLGFTGLGFRV